MTRRLMPLAAFLAVTLVSATAQAQEPDGAPGPGVPFIRSFESSNTLVLRDGQSQRYTAAADRLSGETIRVDVMLTVLD